MFAGPPLRKFSAGLWSDATREKKKKKKKKLAESRVLFGDPETPRKLARPRKTGKMTVEEGKGRPGKPGLLRLARCFSPESRGTVERFFGAPVSVVTGR